MSARKAPSVFARVMARLGFVRPSTATASRVFHGADLNRLTGDWFTSILSADQELKGDLRRLRGAARSSVRDDPFAARFPKMLEENVIGHEGPQLQMDGYTTRGTMARRENETVEWAWYEWAEEKRYASADGRLSFVEQLHLMLRTVAIDGEALVRHIRGADNPFGYSVQVIDPDHLDESLGNATPVKLPSGNLIVMGVEMEPRFRRPVAYWLWSSHPSETGGLTRKHERIPAEDLEHLFLSWRVGQSRGVSWLAPVLMTQKMLGAYAEAAINVARVGASSMAALTYDPEKAAGIAMPPNAGDVIPMEVEPGRFLRLNPGEGVQALPFEYPSEQFGPFIKNFQRAMAVGLNVAYTSHSGDLEAVNYSSIRAGLLSERDFYRGLQQWLGRNICRPIFREWAKSAALMGKIPARETQRYLNAAGWKWRGWKWVDPRNDAEAAALAIKEGFTTRSAVCAEQGEDFEEVIDRLKYEQDYAKEAGVTLGAPAPGTPAQPEVEDNAEENEDTRRLRLARSL